MRLQAVRDWQDKSWVFDGHAAGPVGGTAAPLWTRVVVEGDCPDADAGLVFGGAALGSDAYIAAAAAKALRKRAANTAPLLELATTNPYEAHWYEARWQGRRRKGVMQRLQALLVGIEFEHGPVGVEVIGEVCWYQPGEKRLSHRRRAGRSVGGAGLPPR